jgi:hypothetical protein
LRKTGFAEVFQDLPTTANKFVSKIPKSPMMTRRKSMDNCSLLNSDDDSLRRIPVYQSVRKLQSQQKDRTPLKENTWNGRSSASPTNQTKKRPQVTPDTFKAPSRSTSLTRNVPGTSRTKPASSVKTSPIKFNSNNIQSPLAAQLLEVAGKAKNDAQIVGKIKQILDDYTSKNKIGLDDFTNGHDEAANGRKSINESPKKTAARSRNVNVSRIPAPVRSNTGLY